MWFIIRKKYSTSCININNYTYNTLVRFWNLVTKHKKYFHINTVQWMFYIPRVNIYLFIKQQAKLACECNVEFINLHFSFIMNT